jgi:hypothetical protein
MSERIAFKSAGAVRLSSRRSGEDLRNHPMLSSEPETPSDIKAELTAALVMMTDMYESKFGDTTAVLMARAVILRAKGN